MSAAPRGKSEDNAIKVRDYLRTGVRVGERLPGERELAARLGIGRAALRPVLERLEAEGVLRRQPQSGTFLAAVPAPPVRGARVALVAPFAGADGAGRAPEAGWLFRVASAFERAARPAGAEILVLDQSAREAGAGSVTAMAQEAAGAGAGGAVLLHPLGTRALIARALAMLHDRGVHPLIVSARTYPGLASQAYFDGGWGAYLAARHLLQRGHTRLGFVGAARGHEWVQERLRGCRGALEAADVPADALWAWLPEGGERLPDAEDGVAAFRAWQGLPPEARPTGVVAANDIVALGLLAAARQAGVAVPGALSVIGFDNDPAALLAGLTTVERPAEALGEAAARTILERLAAGPEADAVTVRLRPVLLERATVGPPLTSL